MRKLSFVVDLKVTGPDGTFRLEYRTKKKERLKAMVNQDGDNRKEIDIKQLEKSFLNQAAIIWGDERAEIITSILMGSSNSEDPCKQVDVQQHHNARHALWFIYMALCDVIQGTQKFSKAMTTNKIIAHLICLKEFIGSGNVRLKLAVNQLSEAMIAEFPDTPASWTHFLYRHWVIIRAFAHEFKSDEQCFSMVDYEKVSDVLYGRKWIRIWWWKKKISESVKRLKRIRQRMNSKELRLHNEGTDKTQKVQLAS